MQYGHIALINAAILKKDKPMPVNAKLRERLPQLAPYGYIATKTWLRSQGLSAHSIDNLVKSRQLITVAPGVYKRPETPLQWRGLVASLQKMGYSFSVGGLTALEAHGLQHYLSMGSREQVHLYGTGKLPAWVNKLIPDTEFIRHSYSSLFEGEYDSLPKAGSIDIEPASSASVAYALSFPETAILEALMDVPGKVSFEHADQLMAGLTTLSPGRLGATLKRCKNVKVLRLFFWLAERHPHPWRKKLPPGDFNLGSGKRALARRGKLNKKYQITVPEAMYGKAE